jgi:uroporphyrinogen III methyltransferase/synthase
VAAGIVYLVGAGPGDPGLLTRRAAELLERADVVAHDRLVHPDILKLARDAELVDVGKRPGESGSGQPRINELIVARAREGKTVVRLKGGDPFVFGRGGEEAEACAAAGVAFEVVPGVTSAVAGPAYAGIPLTHRAHASWVAVATGHEDPTKPDSSLDWDALARAPTAVFLMGVQRLGQIAGQLMDAGRDPSTPVAAVSWATWPRQRVVRSVLGAVGAEDVSSPAILVVGEVASLAERLDWFASRPLAGKRVFVTRTRARAGALSARLLDLGAEPLEFPAIRIADLDDYAPLDEAVGGLSSYDWCVFTSANGVEHLFRRLERAGLDARAFGGVRIAAVGPATAAALAERGLTADLVPPEFNSAALVASLGSSADAGRVLVVQPVDASNEIVESLSSRGFRPVGVRAYRTVVDNSSVDAGRTAIADGIDAVLFTSGSTVRNFVHLWGPPPEGAVVCCIGPRTADVCAESGVRVDAVAVRQTIDALVEALVQTLHRD